MMASMFDQIWSRLALAHLAQFVFGWHVIPVGLDVVRVWSDHTGWMMGSTPIQAWMPCFTRFGQGWRLAQLAQFVFGCDVIPVGSDMVRVWSDQARRVMWFDTIWQSESS
jgi:hypothetical protein